MLPELITEIPGPRSLALAARLRRVESRNVTYTAPDFPIFWERASGVNVWDVDGNRFLDMTSAFGVTGLGHTAAPLVDAMRAQAGELMHAMGDVHPVELKVRLCEQLSALTFERWGVGMGKTILGNSGFEAVEAALKTALLRTGRPGVLAFEGAYHGLGFGALTVGGLPYFQEPFRAQLKDFAVRFPFPDEADGMPPELETRLRAELGKAEIGAVLLEPIQGRGGIVVPPPELLPLLRQLCNETGALLVLDEIYTGFHRTGSMFACEQTGTIPDVICLGKALTGGFPLSACVGRAEIMDAWPESSGEALHTSTFLGNPVGCAMALAALELHARSETAALVAETARHLRSALEGIQSPRVRRIRGRGLMLGLELSEPGLGVELMKAALRKGILMLADGPRADVLAGTPPFAITAEDIHHIADHLQYLLSVV